MQIQEDGLPTVLFGDMNFGNNDYWTRFDEGDTIQAVRGGAASTLASGAPGAIINYITPTGNKDGGFVSLDKGIGQNDLTKFNFGVGGHISDDLRYHAEGYLMNGPGARDQGFDAQKGYQIKANITKTLAQHQGFIRLNLKALDEQAPVYVGMPALLSGNAGSVTGISPFPGFDNRTGSYVGIYNQQFRVYDNQSGTFKTVDASGIHPKATAIGAEAHLTPGHGLTFDDKFRYTVMSGTFASQFNGLTPLTSVLGSTDNGQTVGAVRYANGPLTGQAFNGQYLNAGTQIYTNMSDMGNIVNDMSFTKALHVTGGRVTAHGGLFYMDQTIAQDWHPNSSYQTLDGINPAGLNLYSTTGQLLTLNGVSGFNTAWGAGTNRSYNIHAADTAPYLNMTWDHGPMTIEGGVRRDILHVTGWAESASAATTTTQMVNGALVSTSTVDPTTYEPLNYKAAYNSYTLGGLYMLNDNTTAFARISRGGRFNVDRNILSGYTNPDGTLNSSGSQLAISMVNQQEVGIKREGHIADTAYSIDATLFHNTYASSNFDLTKGVAGTYYDSAYKATGLELEGGLAHGGFSLVGNLTYTDAIITANAQGPTPTTMVSTGVGNEPPGTPKLMWMLAPSYRYGPYSGGVMIVGMGRTNVSTSPQYWVPAEVLVHLHLGWQVTKRVSVGLNIHNLFNKQMIGGQLDQGGLTNPYGNGQYLQTVGAVDGRLTTLSVTYKF